MQCPGFGNLRAIPRRVGRLGGQFRPRERQPVVALHTAPGRVVQSRQPARAADFPRPAKPAQCPHVASRHAPSVHRENSERILPVRIILCRGRPNPPHDLHIISRHTKSIGVPNPHPILRHRNSPGRSLTIPFDGVPVTFRHFFRHFFTGRIQAASRPTHCQPSGRLPTANAVRPSDVQMRTSRQTRRISATHGDPLRASDRPRLASRPFPQPDGAGEELTNPQWRLKPEDPYFHNYREDPSVFPFDRREPILKRASAHDSSVTSVLSILPRIAPRTAAVLSTPTTTAIRLAIPRSFARSMLRVRLRTVVWHSTPLAL